MSELEHARDLLAMAGKDLCALKAMTDAATFAEEIFGFHAQQAVEKSLKAWLATQAAQYPLRHDLAELLKLLENKGCDVSSFKHLSTYTDYAIRLRYEAIDDFDETLDRREVCDEVQALFVHVQKLIEQSAKQAAQ